MATNGSCIREIENAENTAPAGTALTSAMNVLGSSGAP